MMKATPLVNAPDDAKMDLPMDFFGKIGGEYDGIWTSFVGWIGCWKRLWKLLEKTLIRIVVVIVCYKFWIIKHLWIFSFVDCVHDGMFIGKEIIDWEISIENNGDGILQIIELEDLEREMG